MLLPFLVSPAKEKKYTIGIIPHWRETDRFIAKYSKTAHVIDIRTDDIKSFIEVLTSCEYILSSSLHGIIIAHAYGIPALLIEKREEKEYPFEKEILSKSPFITKNRKLIWNRNSDQRTL